MIIDKKLIHFKTKENFNKEVANGKIFDNSIVFIQDTKEIYTHGVFYNGDTFDSSSLEASIEQRIEELLDNVNNIYVTDFTIEDLYTIYDNHEPLTIDKDSFVNAVSANKIIIIPYTLENTGGGYIVNVDAREEDLWCAVLTEYANITFVVQKNTNEIIYDSMYIVELQELLIDGETIKTINGESILDSGDLELATKEEVNAKADDSNVVHTNGDETVDGVKTFRYSIKAPGGIALGPGAAIRSYNNVDDNTSNVLSYQHGAFVVNSSDHPLYLTGQSERAKYNNAEMAMLSDVEGKQDAISDLDTIRSGAAKGATALQEEQYKGTIEAVDTNDSVDDVEIEYATIQYVDNAIANAITTTLNMEV